MASAEPTCWLMKAEPEERLERGVDVSFGIDRFAKEKVTSWEGVRNHEAKKILKERMKNGQKALIYHSNTRLPGVAGTGKIVREGYPDHNAWDPSHPYYDPKSKADAPTWYMVDVEFVSKLPFFVPLKLLQTLADLTSPPACIPYLTQSQLQGIKKMALLNRGRLSVQPVEERVYEAITELGTKGEWEELMPQKGKKAVKAKKREAREDDVGEEVDGKEKTKQGPKRKEPAAAKEGTRSSKRQKKA